MNLIRTATFAGALVLAMTAHASADPFSISVFLFNATFLGSVLSFQALYVGVNVAIAAFAALASAAAGGAFNRRQQQPSQGQYKNLFESSEMSEIRAVGRTRGAGLKIFGNTSGYVGHRLIGHAKGPNDFVEEHYLGGRLVTVEENGAVSSPPWAKPGGDSWVYIFWKPGDGTETSWTLLQSAYPTLWTADHKVQGIAQSLVVYESPGIDDPLFLKLYQSGYALYEQVARREPVYDPREDDLNGGVGDQRRDDGDTWTWTDNGILCAVHIMRSYPDFTSGNFDWEDIRAEADRADALVATLTGTEKRSRCWGHWQSEGNRQDVMDDVLRSIGAEVQTSPRGLIRIRLIDDVRSGALTFTDDHIIEFAWDPGPEAPARPNTCRLQFYSQERNFEMAEINLADIAWARVSDEVARYGAKNFDVDLPFCPSASQAQRIARRLFAVARANTGIIITNMAGLAAWDQTVINIAFPDLDETAVCLIPPNAPPRIDDAGGRVEIPFIEQPELSEWDPASDEAPAPEEIPDLAYDAALPTPTTVTALIVEYPDTSKEIRFRYGLSGSYTVTEASYRLYSGGLPGSWSAMTEVASPIFAWATAGAQGQVADFRVQIFNADGEGSYPGELSVTLAEVNTAPGMPEGSYTGNHNALDMEATTAIADLHTATLRLRRRFLDASVSPSYGAWQDRDGPDVVRPGLVVEYSDSTPGVSFDFGDKVEWQIVPTTSDGTEGTPLSFEFEPLPPP